MKKQFKKSIILSQELAFICKINEPMKYHTTIKIGGQTRYFFEPQNINQLKEILNFCAQNNLRNSIIGNGSNILFSSSGYNGAIIKIGKNFSFSYKNCVKILKKRLNLSKNIVFYKYNKLFFCKKGFNISFFSSGISISYLSNFFAKNNLSGLEFAVSIPGTLGGGIVMNAGAFSSEISNILVSVIALDLLSNKIKIFSNVDCNFGYRKSFFQTTKFYIILGAFLILKKGDKKSILDKMANYIAVRKSTQNVLLPSAGSVFKRTPNFVPAEFFDKAGFKGTTVGDAQLSKVHSGYIVNLSNATSDDVLSLIKFLSEKVLQITKYVLELEIILMGDF